MIIVYHGNCYDGFGAAWAARLAIGDEGNTFISAVYGAPIPDELHPTRLAKTKQEVVLVDFTYPRDVLLAIAAVTKVTVLDHHRSAQKDLEDLPFATFNMEHSGAYLSWCHFHPGRLAPKLIQYVEDRDLWHFWLPNSKEVTAWLQSWPKNFDTWDGLNVLLEGGSRVITDDGGAILRVKAQQVSDICDQVQMGWIGGYQVPIVNTSVSFSEVAEELCRRFPDKPFGAYYLDRGDGRRQFGLRSRGDFDVSEVAVKLGGGGHRNAAGFEVRIGHYFKQSAE